MILRHSAGTGAPMRVPRALLAGVAMLLAGIAFVAWMEHLEGAALTAGTAIEELFVYKLIGYGNLLLIGSAGLYVAHLRFTSRAVGRLATGFAAAGSLATLLALATCWIETVYLQRPGHVPLSSLYEVMAFFSAVTVVIYLVMESVYRSRSAGAFVMLIVLAAVLFQIRLAANGEAIAGGQVRILRAYWMQAHVLGTLIGYGAFAVAAAMGLAYLVSGRVRSGNGGFGLDPQSLPEPEDIDRWMRQAILFGFVVFGAATVLGALWARQAWGRYWGWEPKETWALGVWLTYGSYFVCRWASACDGRRRALWSIAGFALTVFGFFGVSALWPGLHAAVQVMR